MLGLSKDFVIFLFLSLAIGYGTSNWIVGVQIMVGYVVVKIVWRFFTGKRNG